jgi:hypothetical protein
MVPQLRADIHHISFDCWCQVLISVFWAAAAAAGSAMYIISLAGKQGVSCKCEYNTMMNFAHTSGYGCGFAEVLGHSLDNAYI